MQTFNKNISKLEEELALKDDILDVMIVLVGHHNLVGGVVGHPGWLVELPGLGAQSAKFVVEGTALNT